MRHSFHSVTYIAMRIQMIVCICFFVLPEPASTSLLFTLGETAQHHGFQDDDTNNETEDFVFGTVEKVPLSSLQLGPAALISPATMKELGIEPEQEAELSVADRRVRVLLYPINRAKHSISLNLDIRERLNVEPGSAKVVLKLIKDAQTTLESRVGDVKIVTHEGDTKRWPGIVLGSPHGDCDLFTGEIAKLVTENHGIPTISVLGSRVTYIGRWIDANRPLQRKPNNATLGILPYRDWTDEAIAVFEEYRKRAIQIGGLPDPGEAPLQSPMPLQLYLDFHGHDLSVTDEQGNRIYRNVFECVARGFNSAEVNELKRVFDRCVQSEYGVDAPPSYWGNLAEDQTYLVSGVKTRFFYNGLGARVYGILASDIAQRAIHIESPNMIRLPPANRERTARVLANFLKTVSADILPRSIERQSVVPPSGDAPQPESWANVAAGEFLMGAPNGEEWSIERPQHRVWLDNYEIAKHEITCLQFAEFVNAKLLDGTAEIENGSVVNATNRNTLCTLFPKGPLAMLRENNGIVSVFTGRENHPVNYVSWFGATAYADAKNACLPSEAQWEKAAAWNETAGRPFRTSISLPRYGPQIESALANGGCDSENFRPPSTSAVGSFSNARSPVGCFDMAGNVWEWTGDWFGKYDPSGDDLKNPVGPSSGSMKAIRGGGWDSEPFVATPTYRIAVHPNQTLPNLGFRLARNPIETRD